MELTSSELVLSATAWIPPMSVASLAACCEKSLQLARKVEAASRYQLNIRNYFLDQREIAALSEAYQLHNSTVGSISLQLTCYARLGPTDALKLLQTVGDLMWKPWKVLRERCHLLPQAEHSEAARPSRPRRNSEVSHFSKIEYA